MCSQAINTTNKVIREETFKYILYLISRNKSNKTCKNHCRMCKSIALENALVWGTIRIMGTMQKKLK